MIIYWKMLILEPFSHLHDKLSFLINSKFSILNSKFKNNE